MYIRMKIILVRQVSKLLVITPEILLVLVLHGQIETRFIDACDDYYKYIRLTSKRNEQAPDTHSRQLWSERKSS